MISMIDVDRKCSDETPCLEKGTEEEVESTVCLSKNQISNEMLNPKRWGAFSKAVRIMAWVFRFVNNMISKS